MNKPVILCHSRVREYTFPCGYVFIFNTLNGTTDQAQIYIFLSPNEIHFETYDAKTYLEIPDEIWLGMIFVEVIIE